MPMRHFANIQNEELPPLDAGENVTAFTKDIVVSEDPQKPMTGGLFRMEKGGSLTYTYEYHELKIIIDGSFILEDESGQKVTAIAGDLLYFPKGSTITFSTKDYGVGFFCGQRGEGEG